MVRLMLVKTIEETLTHLDENDAGSNHGTANSHLSFTLGYCRIGSSAPIHTLLGTVGRVEAARATVY
jgi:hypothetical protein